MKSALIFWLLQCDEKVYWRSRLVKHNWILFYVKKIEKRKNRKKQKANGKQNDFVSNNM